MILIRLYVWLCCRHAAYWERKATKLRRELSFLRNCIRDCENELDQAYSRMDDWSDKADRAERMADVEAVEP